MRNKIKILSIAIIILVISITIAPKVFAADATFYVSPSATSVVSGNNLTVAVRISSSTVVNAVQADLSYPADKLEYISTSFSGSAFEIQAQSTGGGGAVQIARGTFGSVTGDALIAIITFRAKADTGTASISYTAGTSAANNGTELSIGKNGVVISLTSPPAPAPSPAPSSTTKSTPTPQKVTTNTQPSTPQPPTPQLPASPKDEVGPSISDITVTNITQNSATVEWKTNEPSTSIVEYGLNSAYGLGVDNRELVTNHKVVLSSSMMLPKVTYHYKISGTDSLGNKNSDEDRTFITKGIPYTLTLLQDAQKPAKGIEVIVDGETVKTNDEGKAYFELGVGDKLAILNGAKTEKPITFSLGIDDINKIDAGQAVTVTPIVYTPWWLIAVPITLLVGIYIGKHINNKVFWNRLRKQGRLHWWHRKLTVSQLERHFGDKNAKANPYYKQSVLMKMQLALYNLLHNKSAKHKA